jgi:hypothetical protein
LQLEGLVRALVNGALSRSEKLPFSTTAGLPKRFIVDNITCPKSIIVLTRRYLVIGNKKTSPTRRGFQMDVGFIASLQR